MKPTDDMENWIEKLQNEEREAREAQERQKAREQDFADFEAKRADREWRLSPEGQRVAELIVAAVEKGEYLPWHEAQQLARQQLAADGLEAKKQEWAKSPEGQRVAEMISVAAEKWEYLSWHEAQVMARQQLAAENAEKKDVAKPSQVEVEEQRVVRDDREGGVQLAAEKLEAAKSPQIKDGGTREPAKAPLEPSQSVGHAVVATPAVGALIQETLEKFKSAIEAFGYQVQKVDWERADREIKREIVEAVRGVLHERAASPHSSPYGGLHGMVSDIFNGLDARLSKALARLGAALDGVAARLVEAVRGKGEGGKEDGGQRPYPGPRLEDQLAATIDVMAEKFGKAISAAIRQVAADLKNDHGQGRDRFHDDGRSR